MVTPTTRCALVEHLQSAHALSSRSACRIVGLSRSVIHRPIKDWEEADALVIEAPDALLAKHSRWGFWKLHSPTAGRRPRLEPQARASGVAQDEAASAAQDEKTPARASISTPAC